MRPRLLDLYCKAGGATRGYQLAGFHVTGVDIECQPHYCGDEFILADALTVDLNGYDAIHASPPCQHYANVTRWRGDQSDHPALIAPTIERLVVSGVPWIVENVPGAPIESDFMLCGSMFGLPIRRHRWFATSWTPTYLIQPCGHRRNDLPFEHKGERAYTVAMGCGWMNRDEGRQAIPPAYTEFIGRQLLAALEAVA